MRDAVLGLLDHLGVVGLEVAHRRRPGALALHRVEHVVGLRQHRVAELLGPVDLGRHLLDDGREAAGQHLDARVPVLRLGLRRALLVGEVLLGGEEAVRLDDVERDRSRRRAPGSAASPGRAPPGATSVVELLLGEERVLDGGFGGRLLGDDRVGPTACGASCARSRGWPRCTSASVIAAPAKALYRMRLLPEPPAGRPRSRTRLARKCRCANSLSARRPQPRLPMTPPSSSSTCCAMIASNEASASKPSACARAASKLLRPAGDDAGDRRVGLAADQRRPPCRRRRGAAPRSARRRWPRGRACRGSGAAPSALGGHGHGVAQEADRRRAGSRASGGRSR